MLQELTDLVDEVRLSFYEFSEFARRAHGDRIDPSGRAVLEYLARNGMSTVPAIARARRVTRQHIQTIVNGLESSGLVQSSANPAHRRSPLFSLTSTGAMLIESVAQTEAALIEPLRGVIDADRLSAAAATLAEIREFVAGLERAS